MDSIGSWLMVAAAGAFSLLLFRRYKATNAKTYRNRGIVLVIVTALLIVLCITSG